MTSIEVGAYLERAQGVIVPTGSLEQHGPIGLTGTDAICAEQISLRAGDIAEAIVAPVIGYAPAQFNMAFPGTVSVSSRAFINYVREIVLSLRKQGFTKIYFLNGHGANLAALQCVMHDVYAELDNESPRIRIKSWWDFENVNVLRDKYFGEREGLHATPSEISITQHIDRVVHANMAEGMSAIHLLDTATIKDLAGDKHAPASAHKAEYPDGRVGSDSALATPEAGEKLLRAAAQAVAQDYLQFNQTNQSR